MVSCTVLRRHRAQGGGDLCWERGDEVRSALRTCWIALLAGCSALAANSDGGRPAEALIGLWGFEQILGPLVAGELTVDARGPEWRARIAGYDGVVSRPGERPRAGLPRGGGGVRARFDPAGKASIGRWV